ncbi:phosphoribosylglycinamide formyltransferase [Rhodobacteraceae bacterium KN286]|uniref:Phosphoribosylglycinamide formyltransferase n=2 Tax=Oceanomicrobium pacificus TaxID=2692916 RepID=A0A6B0U448_9RHOB|nr:phosphoribosylglycinamide formyltransferase [Oceanomicrobium pacificus]
MEALLRDMARDDHPGKPVLVLSNRPGAGGLARAAKHGVPTETIDHRAFKGDREAFDAALNDALEKVAPDIICLAGFMRILTPVFLDRWAGRVLNIHPSILPLFKGLDTHQRALDAGMAVHGCTVHEVTPDLDAGPILGQAILPVRQTDTAETLAARLLPLEHRLYPAVLRKVAAGDRSPTAILGTDDG